MECGKMQSLFGVAVGNLELAKRNILEVMEHMYPGFITDEQRSEWLRKLLGAHIAIMGANQKVEDAAAEIHPDGKRFPAHPEVAEQSSQELLEASKQIVEWWLDQGQQQFSGAPAAMFNLRAAIAKAEGRPNA